MQNQPQTAKKRPQTGPTVTVRGGTAGTGAGGGERPVVSNFNTTKTDFSVVFQPFWLIFITEDSSLYATGGGSSSHYPPVK